jgi:hypothetical protein
MGQADEEPEDVNEESTAAEKSPRFLDPLLALCGSGKEIWADEHADEYVANLRKDWD